MQISFKRRSPALAAGFCLLAFAAIPSVSSADTVKVGQLVTEGGTVQFPTSARKALGAVLKEANKKGVNGHKFALSTINDDVNPTNAAAATRKLLDDGVVAFVGSDSVFDCSVNAPLYKQAGIYGVGLGIGGPCFGMPQFASVGNSPATTNAVELQWAYKHIGKKICMLGVNFAGFAPQYVGANRILDSLGLKLTYQLTTLAQDANSSSTVLDAAQKGCQAAVINFTPTQTIQALQMVKRQKLKLQLIGASGQYSDLLRKGLGSTGNGYILGAQMQVWHEKNKQNKAYLALMKKYRITTDEFSESAYISGLVFLAAVKSIKGPVTRASVGAALKKLKYKTGMLAEPWSFNHPAGTDGGNAPNVSTRLVVIKNGKFVTKTGFLGLPKKSRKFTVNFN